MVNLACTLLSLALVVQGQPLAALLAGHGLSVPYNLVAGVGVWRSAARYRGPPGLAAAARFVATAGLGILSIV